MYKIIKNEQNKYFICENVLISIQVIVKNGELCIGTRIYVKICKFKVNNLQIQIIHLSKLVNSSL